MAIFNNVPAPDYAWFYSPMWMYTLAEGTQNQKQILRSTTRPGSGGAPFTTRCGNDYAIAENPAPAFSRPSRSRPLPSTPSAHHFAARERIFAPGIAEVITKLNLAQRTQITAQTSGAAITTTLDLSRLTADERVQPAGMGRG